MPLTPFIRVRGYILCYLDCLGKLQVVDRSRYDGHNYAAHLFLPNVHTKGAFASSRPRGVYSVIVIAGFLAFAACLCNIPKDFLPQQGHFRIPDKIYECSGAVAFSRLKTLTFRLFCVKFESSSKTIAPPVRVVAIHPAPTRWMRAYPNRENRHINLLK